MNPNYKIAHQYNIAKNTITLEYYRWNKKEKKYDTASESIIYQLDEDGKINSWLISNNNNNMAQSFTSDKANTLINQNSAYIFQNKFNLSKNNN